MKRGQFNIFTFMIVAFISVVFFAGLIYTMGILNDVFYEVGVTNDQNPPPIYNVPCIDNASNTCVINTYVNMTLAGQQIWGSAYDSIQALRLVAIVYILCYAFAIMIIGAFERKHPILFFAYFLIGLLGVIFAPLVSNAYESLLNSNIFEGELVNFTASNFILLNLPTVVLAIYVMGLLFLFINLIRGGGNENISL